MLTSDNGTDYFGIWMLVFFTKLKILLLLFVLNLT